MGKVTEIVSLLLQFFNFLVLRLELLLLLPEQTLLQSQLLLQLH
ncbi:hypothetical protein [Moorena producens]